jgi:hypothetical protein
MNWQKRIRGGGIPMDINQALANIGVYNAMRDTLTSGILGLEQYKGKRIQRINEIKRTLGICQQFCKSFISIAEERDTLEETLQNAFTWSSPISPVKAHGVR